MVSFVTFKVLMKLMDGKVHSASKLAIESEVSTKTIQRAVDTLLSAGIFVESKKGKFGGYYLSKNSIPHLSQVSTKELAELLSICKFKESITPSEKSSTSLTSTIINSTPEKHVKEVLEKSNKLIIDSLPWGKNTIKNRLAEELHSASLTNNIVEFDYTSFNGSKSHRNFQPYCIILKNGTWYTYGESLGKMKLFKLTRIKNLKVTSSIFSPKPYVDISSKPWNNLENFEQKEILLQISKNHLDETREWLDFIIQEQSPTFYIASATVHDNIGLYHKLIEESKNIKLLSPYSMVEKLLSLCKNVQNIYKTSHA